MKKSILIFLTLIALLIQPSFQVLAQADQGEDFKYLPGVNLKGGRFRLGNLSIVPGFTLEAVYDDNIFLSAGESVDPINEVVESDMIGFVKPALLIDYDLGLRGDTSLLYQGDFAFYQDFEENDWQTHKLSYELDYKAPGGLIVGINNRYVDAEDPYGSLNDFNLGVPLTERWYNDLKTELGYQFGNRLRALGLFNHYKQDFDDAQDFTQDYEEMQYGAGTELRVAPKTWAFVRFHLGERDYFTERKDLNVSESNDADFDFQQVSGGLTWDSGARLIGELNFGYQWIEFENEVDRSGRPFEDDSTWVAATSMHYIPEREPFNPDYGMITFNLSRAFRLVGSNTGQYFEDTSIGLIFRQIVYDKVIIEEGLEFRSTTFRNPNNEETDQFFGRIRLTYKFKPWLSALVGYEHNKKDSTVETNDYRVNRITFAVNAAF
jgi:hypothetical protein